MKKKIFFAALSALALTVALVASAGSDKTREYKDAVSLYKHGMYDEARLRFEALAQQGDDALCEGYAVLCAIQTRAQGYESLIQEYQDKYASSVLMSQIHYQYGLRLFDDNEFTMANNEFSQVKTKTLSQKEKNEMLFRQAYSDFGLENYRAAKSKFEQLEKLPFSDYTAPVQYALGYIAYNDNDFKEAFNWFEKSQKDDRFKEISDYYMLECRFMQKDYDYVTENASAVYQENPEERRPHLARIISEAYLVMGDTASAKAYFDENSLSESAKNRADYFYAGSLQYALGEYPAAIENFSKMEERVDSLGQIANYELGYSYIQIKNKVNALTAFSQAAAAEFDSVIQEDAYFNHAKLAFDINHDVSVFKSYLAKYSDTKRGSLIYSYIAQASLYNHDYAAAVEAYDNIDELDTDMRSNYMKANYLRAEQLISNGSYRDAIPCLRAATFFTPRTDNFNKLARYWLAESYFKTENYAEAVKVYTDLLNLSALENQDEGKSLTYNLGYSYFKQNDFVSASKMFDRYIASGVKTAREDALIRRADCDFIIHDYKAAATQYQNVLAEFDDPEDIYPYYQLGLSYGLSGNNKDKVKALERVKHASASSPLYADAMYELGRAYVDTKNQAAAIQCFETLRAQSKDSSFVAKSLIELGLIARNAKKTDEAISDYKQVVERFPDTDYSASALLALESIYQSKGEPEKYLDYVKNLGKPMDQAEAELVYFNTAEQIFLTENYEKALVSLAKYVGEYPQGTKLAEAYFYMGESNKALGNKEKAADCYAKAIETGKAGSFTESALLNFATLSYGLEHYGEAYGAYKSLLEQAQIDANKFTAEQGMMRSAYKAKDYADAINCASVLKADSRSTDALKREADYVSAMSYLATSQREQAFALFRSLSNRPSTDEGAEASYLLIQDTYDQGNFNEVEAKVYKFAESAGGQNYWLAKAYIVLGDAFMENDNVKQAKATFESLLNGYTPERGSADDVLDNVKMRLKKLEDYE